MSQVEASLYKHQYVHSDVEVTNIHSICLSVETKDEFWEALNNS